MKELQYLFRHSGYISDPRSIAHGAFRFTGITKVKIMEQ
jgi:hypothetical protein